MRRFAKCQLERTRKMSGTSPGDGAQILGMNRAVQILVDEGPHPGDLPARQSPRRGPFPTRMALDLVLQDGPSSGERHLCRLAIMLELVPGRFKELCWAACQIAQGQIDRQNLRRR